MLYILSALAVIVFVGLFAIFQALSAIQKNLDNRFNQMFSNFAVLEEKAMESLLKPSYDFTSHLEEIDSDLKNIKHCLGKPEKKKVKK